jgi:hypothetical protein
VSGDGAAKVVAKANLKNATIAHQQLQQKQLQLQHQHNQQRHAAQIAAEY